MVFPNFMIAYKHDFEKMTQTEKSATEIDP